ncbi:hypothetical protein C5E14_15500 [Rathayibacter sp. AY1A1]|nr:hypothetical protein C5E14_15500 [Rathayibacter sp. AY1A1]PPG80873.1 hypothetical protein C5C29_16435 [Rathayibacter sp. AY1H2]PPG99512.1 hypothetical protein C5C32_11480 [Rathayibacter sp. AY1G9]
MFVEGPLPARPFAVGLWRWSRWVERVAVAARESLGTRFTRTAVFVAGPLPARLLAVGLWRWSRWVERVAAAARESLGTRFPPTARGWSRACTDPAVEGFEEVGGCAVRAAANSDRGRGQILRRRTEETV